MIKKIDVGYIGFSLTMLSELLCSPFFNLKECILEETRCTDQIRTICKTNHVKLFEARNKKHLSEILIQESEENVFIMYENGIIIENAALCGKHIYNFHSGSFLNNRGAHPIVWSILNNDTFTEMTLHEIDADIDQGTKVDTRAVAIDENDDIDSLKMKLEALIPDLLLSLFNHILRREYFEKQFNRYNRRIELIDYTIDLGKDSMEDIFRKVRSQSAYKGAVLFADEEKIYIHKVKKIGQTGQFYRKENGQKCIEIRQILEILD
ncbi:MAG: hypothetical protein HFF89_08000 [Oscillibacter sp.]|nr:hypothetical protein [Oscillibacter sp.]MCI9376903.1 hypothetical protein [Oscillibacter sp.]